MDLKNIGKIFHTDTKTKLWWTKLAVALVLSNIFFFYLFSGPENVTSEKVPELPVGSVEVQMRAELQTPFQKGKKVLLVSRQARKIIPAVLHEPSSDVTEKVTVIVNDEVAHQLFEHDSWEILPFLKKMAFKKVSQGVVHEIRY